MQIFSRMDSGAGGVPPPGFSPAAAQAEAPGAQTCCASVTAPLRHAPSTTAPPDKPPSEQARSLAAVGAGCSCSTLAQHRPVLQLSRTLPPAAGLPLWQQDPLCWGVTAFCWLYGSSLQFVPDISNQELLLLCIVHWIKRLGTEAGKECGLGQS